MIRRKTLPPNWDQVNRMNDALKGESDRGIVLVSATIIDETLKRCIEAHMVNHKDVKRLLDSGVNAPLGTFWTRILASLAIGIFGEDEYHNLDIIRKIRNEFAHSVDVSFKSSKIETFTNHLLLESPTLLAICDTPRKKFIMCASWLILILESRIPELIEQRLFFQEWSETPTEDRSSGD